MITDNRALATDRVITPAETRVAIAYTLGDIGKEVADRLGIAHGTVVRHTQNIYEKVGCRHSTNALVAWFLSQNYDIDLGELRRRLGAMVLMVLFSTFTFGNPDTDLPRRATRRGGRRNEVELFSDNHEYF